MAEKKEEEIDVCSIDGFRKLIEENPDLLVVVAEKDSPTAPTLREEAYKMAEEKKLPLAELEFKEGKSEECVSLDPDLRKAAPTGVLVLFREGKEVGRVKATGFKDFDRKHVLELLEKAGLK